MVSVTSRIDFKALQLAYKSHWAISDLLRSLVSRMLVAIQVRTKQDEVA